MIAAVAALLLGAGEVRAVDSYFPAAQGLRWAYALRGDADRGYHSAPLGSLELSIRGPITLTVETEPGRPVEEPAWRLAGRWFGADALVVN